MIKKLVLKQPASPEDSVPVEVIAQSIKAIAEGVEKLRKGPLNERAIILLIQHACPSVKVGRYSGTPISARTVKAVLDGMEQLKREYLRVKKTGEPL